MRNQNINKTIRNYAEYYENKCKQLEVKNEAMAFDASRYKKEIAQVLSIQKSDGNWNYSPYMMGMANGLILAEAILNGSEPEYLSAPSVWVQDVSAEIVDTEPTQQKDK